MGCDIHTEVEIQGNDGEWHECPLDPPVFKTRNYEVFAFLADVRNYACLPSIAADRGYPEGREAPLGMELHSATYVTLAELLAYDYDQIVENRRVTINGNGGCTAEPGNGTKEMLRSILEGNFFEDLKRLTEISQPSQPDHGEVRRKFDLDETESKPVCVPPERIRVLMYFDN